jgi:hypothetical protein
MVQIFEPNPACIGRFRRCHVLVPQESRVSPPLPSAQLRVMAAMATPGLDELGESAGTHQDLGRPEVRPFCSGKVAETHMESYG